jgi:hypothetical protein
MNGGSMNEEREGERNEKWVRYTHTDTQKHGNTGKVQELAEMAMSVLMLIMMERC